MLQFLQVIDVPVLFAVAKVMLFMTYIVTLQHSGEQFSVNCGESILHAGLRQGVQLPYGCKSGICGTCVCYIVDGDVECSDPEAIALLDEDDSERTLCCLGFPSSDLTINLKFPEIDFEPWG